MLKLPGLILLLLTFASSPIQARIGDRLLFGPVDAVGRVEVNRGGYVCICGGVEHSYRRIDISTESRRGRRGQLQEGHWYEFRLQEKKAISWRERGSLGNLGPVELDEDCQPISVTVNTESPGVESIAGDALEVILSTVIGRLCGGGRQPCVTTSISAFETTRWELARDELKDLLDSIMRSPGRAGHHGSTGHLSRFFELPPGG